MRKAISAAFDPSFFEQFLKANQLLEEYVSNLDRAASKHIGTSSGNPNSIADLAGQQKTLLEAVVAVSKAETEALQAKKALTNEAKALERELAKQEKAAGELSNDYGQLSKAYTEATLRAKNYVLQLGASHTSSVTAIEDARRMGAQLKTLDAAVGQHQRNVGNYASAYNGLGFSMRTIASELPNLGISFRTFAQSVSNNIGPLTEAIKAARVQNAALAAEGKPTISIGKQIASAIFNWQTAILALVAAGVYLIDYLGTSNKSLDAHAVSLDRSTKSLEKWTEAKQAQITALKEENDDNLLVKGNNRDIKVMERQLDILKQQHGKDKEIFDLEQKITRSRIASVESQELNAKNAFARAKSMQMNSAITGGIQEVWFGLSDERKDLENQLLVNEARFQEKKRREREKENKKDKKDRDKDAAELKREQEEETRTALAQIRGRFQQKKAIATAAYQDETLSEKERQNRMQEAMFAEISIVKLSGAIEKKTKEEIEADITEVTIKYARIRGQISEQEAQEQLDRLKRHRANIKGAGEALGNSATSSRPGNALGWGGDEIQKFENITAYADAAIASEKAIMAVEKARSDARIQQLNNEIDAIRQKRDEDVDAVTASTASEEEKAKLISQINARARAEEKQRNDEIRAEKRKSAELNKAITIAEIAIRTAAAVVNQLYQGDAYSAIPRAIAVGAMGAAELAAAIATPIPSFEVGTENAPEGIAQVHKDELIIPSDGGKPWVVDKDTLTYLKKGSQVKTKDDTAEIFKFYGVGMPALRTKDGKEYPMDEIMDGAANKIVNAIDRKRFPTQQTKPAWWQDYYYQRTK